MSALSTVVFGQRIFEFANGYGASVIRGWMSYGGEQGLFELAVLKGGELCYDTEITDDVIGYLTAQDVAELLARIEALPPITNSVAALACRPLLT